MKFAEYGEENDEVILLLHGGGLAPWNYFEEVQLLKEKYHIIIPVLDGHNGSDRKFTTIFVIIPMNKLTMNTIQIIFKFHKIMLGHYNDI